MKNKVIILLCIIICTILMPSCKKEGYVIVTLCPCNDEQNEEMQIKTNDELTSVKQFSNPGYSFAGWYYDANYQNKVTFPITITKNITLYGGWFINLNYEYDSENKTYAVTGVRYSDKVIEIPTTYLGHPVTKINEGAFSGNNVIEKVILPDTLSTIEDRAFANCDNLKEVNLPDSLKQIGEKIFNNSNKIVYRNINGLKYLNNWLVDGTMAVMSRTSFIEETVGIFPNAFYQNKTLDEIVLPDNIETLYKGTFEDSSLKKLIINQNLKNLDIFSLKNTFQLEEIVVSDDNKYFSSTEGVLYNKEKTKLICYPSSKTNAEYRVLSTTQTIGERACMNNNYLNTLKIPNNVETISEQAFYNCQNLINITFSNRLKEIGDEAFKLCYNIENIILPDSLNIIGQNVFSKCQKVEELVVPFVKSDDKEYSIAYLFGNDISSLKSIEKLTVLGGTSILSTSFRGLINVRYINISQEIKNIEATSFYDCGKVVSLEVNDNANFKIINKLLYTIDGKTLIWCIPTISDTSIFTLATTENIMSNAFKDIEKVSVIFLNDNLVKIEENAFNNLTNLTKLVFNSKVKIVGQDICKETPNITIYIRGNNNGVEWSEGWNTYNYKTIWDAHFPSFKFNFIEKHIEIGEEIFFEYEVFDVPEDYQVKINLNKDEIVKLDGNKITGLKDGITIITFEVIGYPESRSSLYIYVGNI